jgi:DNA-binding Xre family transcriptional regulator
MGSKSAAIGTSFDDFLRDEGLEGEVSAAAMKRVIAWQLAQAIWAKGLSKLAMAKRMGTSRSHLDRILDATDPGLTLETLSKAAQAVGCQVRIELTESEQS